MDIQRRAGPVPEKVIKIRPPRFLGANGTYTTLFSAIPNTGFKTWTVTNPTTTDAFIKVVARDPANNTGQDISNAAFTIRK